MPTPKITEYTTAVPEAKTSTVINIELVVPSPDVDEVGTALDDFLENHVHTVGASAILDHRVVAHSINRAMQILANRKAIKR